MRRTSTRAHRWAQGGALALALLGGAACRSIDATVYNLREYHAEDGTTKRAGAPMGAFQYNLRRSFATLNINLVVPLADASEKPDRALDDPLGDCLDELVELASYNGRRPRKGGLQVEVFSWLAGDDQYILSRERAVLELGKAGLRLGLDSGPRKLPSDVQAASAGDVARVLFGLIRALRRGVGGEPLPSETPAPGEPALEFASVRAACAALNVLPLDREGARRALSVCNTLLGIARRLDADDRRAVQDLQLEMQRRCLERALAFALEDQQGLVRAAAVQASVTCSDNRLPSLVLAAFSDPDPFVAARALRLVRERGVPEPPRPLGQDERAKYDADWISALLDMTVSGDERVRTMACGALSSVARAGFASLRPEDWHAWNRGRGGAEPGLGAGPAAPAGQRAAGR